MYLELSKTILILLEQHSATIYWKMQNRHITLLVRLQVKKLLILCPAFVSDCLETLEEIAERGKETFMEAGGESYTMIPCLNTSPLWVNTVVGLLNAKRAG